MYPSAYLDYLIYFHVERDYFECHEVLEEYWKEHDPKNRTSHWVGLIQIAVGLYHHRRGNLNGASRMYDKAIKILAKNKASLSELGLDGTELVRRLVHQKDLATSTNGAFADIDLPLKKDDVLISCQKRCQKLGINWNPQKKIKNEDIIHKHILRDRSDVISERARQLALKKNQK
jgi:predicted metal-dependent hydrolase